jgi:putative two-component system response regulator
MFSLPRRNSMHPAQPPVSNDSTDALHAQQVLLFATATLAELRDSDTESHLIRVQRYVRLLASQLASQPIHAGALTPVHIEALVSSVPFYDMGTVGVPDRVLLKPGRLSPDELAIMRTHPTLGHAAVVQAEKTLGRSSSLLTLVKELTLSHHEKWSGKGYPQGLAGTAIPLSARIVALADVYDALIGNKVYKDGISHDAAVLVIAGERGAHFDPDVVDAFMVVSSEFAAIARKHADTDEDMQQKIEYLANAIAEHTEL